MRLKGVAYTSMVSVSFLFLVAGLPSLAQEPYYFLVTQERMTCLRQHAQDYEPEAIDQIVFIFVADCGQADASSGRLLDMVEASGPTITVSEGDGPDPVIALTGTELECLATLDIPEKANLLAFFPEACDVEIRE